MIYKNPKNSVIHFKNSYKILSVFVVIATLFTACAGTNTIQNIPSVEYTKQNGYWQTEFITDTVTTIPAGYEKIAENNTETFFFNFSNCIFIVRNKVTGYEWKSDYTPKQNSGLNETWVKTLKSLFILNASDISLNNNVITPYPSVNYNKGIQAKKIENGVALTYLITEINISITVEIKLDSYGLTFKIPEESIIEGVGVNTRIKEIKNEIFTQIDSAIKATEALDTIAGAKSLVQKDTKSFNESLKSIKGMLEPFETPKGIEYAVIQSEQIIADATSIISGGESTAGFVKTLKNAGYSKADLAKCQGLVNTVMDSVNLALSWIGQLKKLKYGGVVSIEVLPFLGTASDFDKGYMLYPDGSGAISKFSENHPSYTTYFNRGIYSDKNINLDLEKERDKSGIKNTTLPVIGVNFVTNGFVGIALDGQEDAEINYYPSGYLVNLNRVSFSFNYRRQVKVTDTRSSVGQKVSNIIERDGNMRDCQVRYLFLTGGKSDYSGMATACRNYFLEMGILKKSAKITPEIPLALNIIMNIKEKNLFYDTNLTMTNFKQVQEILAEYADNGNQKIMVNLLGWTQEGYLSYPTNSNPAGSLGGMKELKALASYAKQKNVDLYLSDNYVDVQSQTGGFRFDQVAKEYNASQISNVSGTEFLFSPKEIYSKYIDITLPKIKSIPVSGISFDKLGSLLYYDYNKENQIKRQESANIWSAMLKKSQEQFGGAAVSVGNLYSLRFADWVQNIPSGDTGYSFSDDSVPFLQMVVHGSVTYTTEPFNLFFDKKLQKLQAIEYGAIPYYFLTKEDTLKLKNTDCNTIFSSVYDEFKEESITISKEFIDNFGPVNDKYIVKHEKLSQDLVKVQYSNGTVIYINYGSVEYNIDNIIVGPENYFVVRGDLV